MTQAPAWVQDLVADVAEAITAIHSAANLGCHVFHNMEDADEWEITLFGEGDRMGGRMAGYVINPVLSLDILELLQAFDVIGSCRWQTLKAGSNDDVGPHVGIEGEYKGHQVWLRILSECPDASVLDRPDSHRARRG